MPSFTICKDFLERCVSLFRLLQYLYLLQMISVQTLLECWLIPQQTCQCYYQAKTTGYFLVLVPLIAFGIRCIMNAFHRRVGRNKLQDVRQASGSMRWKLALRDLSDPDASYTDSRPEIEVSISEKKLLFCLQSSFSFPLWFMFFFIHSIITLVWLNSVLYFFTVRHLRIKKIFSWHGLGNLPPNFRNN